MRWRKKRRGPVGKDELKVEREGGEGEIECGKTKKWEGLLGG